MSSAIILGDPHIGKGAHAIGKDAILMSNKKIQDQFDLLEWLLDYAVEHSVSSIIITGDVFEEPKPHQELITEFMKWLNYCSNNQISVHILFGNHDFLRVGRNYASPLDIIQQSNIPNVHVYNSFENIYIDNSGFTLLPFKDKKSYFVDTPIEALNQIKDSISFLYEEIPKTFHKFCVGHLALEGAIPVGDEFDDLLNELICPLDFFNSYKATFMGHVHKPQVLRKNPYISHVGSMDISNFGEIDQTKSIVVLDCFSGDFYYKEIPTKKLSKITIDIPDDVTNPTKYVEDELLKLNVSDHIVKVEINSTSLGSSATDKKAIEKILLSKGVRDISGISESKKLNLVKKKNKDMSHSLSIKESFHQFVNSEVQDELKQEVLELMLEIYGELQ